MLYGRHCSAHYVSGVFLGRCFAFSTDGVAFMSLGFATWSLLTWELTELIAGGREFVKLQGKKVQNPSWRYVSNLWQFEGLGIRARAPCPLPEELRHHGLMWEVVAREPLLVFSAGLR